jgi:hypothetical protein
MKLITNAMVAASNLPSVNGNACASPPTELRKAHSRPGASMSDLGLGWIESLHLCGRTMRHDQLSKSAVSAADIEPSQSLWLRQPIEKDLTDESAPSAHKAFIGGSIGEKVWLFGHRILPFLWH